MGLALGLQFPLHQNPDTLNNLQQAVEGQGQTVTVDDRWGLHFIQHLQAIETGHH